MSYDYVIVGAGFAGCTCAEQLSKHGSVLLAEERMSIGGLCADSGAPFSMGYYQLFGPHIFHTSNKEVFNYLKQFGDFNDYRHKVRCKLANGKEVPLPVSIATLEALHGKGYTEESAKTYFDENSVKINEPANAEEAVLCRFGEEIYHAIFKGYSEKQWGVGLKELPAHVTMRIPLRLNRNEYYFSDSYQAIPLFGYTGMMKRMIDHENIDMIFGNHEGEIDVHGEKATIWTGPIDQYFNYKYGKLNYRCLEFGLGDVPWREKQKSGCLNHCDYDEPQTRTSEYCLFDGGERLSTKRIVGVEHPNENGEPCYPLITDEENLKADKYREEAKTLDNVHFVGRLAEYKYLNIDNVVANALKLTEGGI